MIRWLPLAAALACILSSRTNIQAQNVAVRVEEVEGVVAVRREGGEPGVQLAGDYTDPEYPPTLEAAVRSGVRAARRLSKIP